MKRASDFRYTARKSLRGRWGIAILAGFIASLLGGLGMSTGSGSGISFDFSELKEIKEINNPLVMQIMLSMLIMTLAVMAVVGFIHFIIGSVIEVCYNRFNLNLIDGKMVKIGQLVSFFPHWLKAIGTCFLRNLYIFLWSLLLIVPGIIAAYDYSMTTYILAEYPDISIREALRLSKLMMYGNKWRLFCLSLSFIGWDILCVFFTLGIGYLWLIPYQKAAFTDFYREVATTVVLPGETAPESAPEVAQATEV